MVVVQGPLMGPADTAVMGKRSAGEHAYTPAELAELASCLILIPDYLLMSLTCTVPLEAVEQRTALRCRRALRAVALSWWLPPSFPDGGAQGMSGS